MAQMLHQIHTCCAHSQCTIPCWCNIIKICSSLIWILMVSFDHNRCGSYTLVTTSYHVIFTYTDMGFAAWDVVGIEGVTKTLPQLIIPYHSLAKQYVLGVF